MAKDDEPPDDPEACELWRSFFDLAKTSIEEALGYFQIDVDPDPDEEDLDDVEVKYEPFELRERQREALQWVTGYFWKLKNRAARIICLKCRRYGVSTFWKLFGLERILRVPGYQALLIAQDDASALKQFQTLRDTFQQIPKWILKERGIEVVKDTDNRLVLRHEGHKSSEFHVAPAKRNAIGRGARYNLIIVTEFPHYPKSAKGDLSGVLAACRNVRGNAIIFEATAKGFEQFYQRYKRAEKRRSDYRAQFIAAFEHPGNRKRFKTVAEEEAFIKSIGTLQEFGPEDELVLFRRLTVDLKWTPHDAAEHLSWRRTEISDVCEGVLDYYHRENPNTPEEAFQGTGLPLFRKEILEAWRPLAEKREQEAERGRLTQRSERVTFDNDSRADLTVFEHPEPGERYAFGADVASGIARHADGKTEADFSVCIVKNARTRVTVARFRAHLPPDEFAEVVFRIACWFNGAKGYIERAINDSGVCISTFEGCEIGKFSGQDLLLSQKRAIKTDHANMRANWKFTPGFQTTNKTKPELVVKIDRMVKALGLPDETKECPWDLQFLDEAGKFERDEHTARMEASEGHDDCVMAEGMCLEAIEALANDPDDPIPVPRTGKPTGDEILIQYSKAMNSHREDEGSEDIDGLS